MCADVIWWGIISNFWMLKTGDLEFDMVCTSIIHSSSKQDVTLRSYFVVCRLFFFSVIFGGCTSELFHVPEMYTEVEVQSRYIGSWNRCINITDVGLQALAENCSCLQSLRSYIVFSTLGSVNCNTEITWWGRISFLVLLSSLGFIKSILDVDI